MYHNKYLKYKKKYLMLRAKNIEYYYGSPIKLDILMPRPSRVIDNEEAVLQPIQNDWLFILLLNRLMKTLM